MVFSGESTAATAALHVVPDVTAARAARVALFGRPLSGPTVFPSSTRHTAGWSQTVAAASASEDHVQLNSEKLSFRIVSSAICGMIGTSWVFPMDLVKTHLQAQAKEGIKVSLRDTIAGIHASGGLKMFYRGLAPNLLFVAPEKALKLTLNDTIRDALKSPDEATLPLWKGIIAGGMAGLGQAVVTNPMELIKIQFQLNARDREAATKAGKTPPTRLTLGTAIKEYNTLAKLYKGTASTLLRDIPFSMVYFSMYYKLKEVIHGDAPGDIPISNVIMASCAAGVTSSVGVTPFDVIKTNLQARNSPYKTIGECARGIYRQGGFQMFWQGAVARGLIITQLFTITIVVYEVAKQAVDDIGDDDDA